MHHAGLSASTKLLVLQITAQLGFRLRLWLGLVLLLVWGIMRSNWLSCIVNMEYKNQWCSTRVRQCTRFRLDSTFLGLGLDRRGLGLGLGPCGLGLVFYHLLQLQAVCFNNKHSCFVFLAHSATSLLFLKCQSSSSSFRLSFDHLACVLNDKPHSPEPSIQFYRVLCFQPLPTLVQNPYQVLFVHSSPMSLLVLPLVSCYFRLASLTAFSPRFLGVV